MSAGVQDLVSRIRATMAREGFVGRPGVAPERLQAFEAAHRVRLPDSFRKFYLQMDGMEDPNWEPRTMTRIWPLAEVKPVSLEFPDPKDGDHSRYPGAFCFADHSIWAWGYAIQLRPMPVDPVVYLVGGEGRLIYAPDFESFLSSLADDRILEPRPA